MQSKNNLCFDVGGMGIKIIHFINNQVIAEDYLQHTEFNKGENTNLINILEKIDSYINNFGKTTSVAIGLPGIIDKKNGKVLTKSFLQELENINIYNFFKKNKLVDKILIENDAKAAAIGEFNNLRLGKKSAFVMTIGSAIGGALILNGKIYNGRLGLAGEISKCYSNLQDESEKVAAHVASTMYAQRKFAKLKGENLNNVSGKDIMKCYLEKDAVAIDCINDLVNSISRLILNIQVVVDVDYFLIGGGISESEIFIEALSNKISHYFLEQNLTNYMPKLRVCSLKNRAGCFGLMNKLMEVNDE